MKLSQASKLTSDSGRGRLETKSVATTMYGLMTVAFPKSPNEQPKSNATKAN